LQVNDRSINQETPLEWAMYRKNVQVIDILVDNGAKINQTFDIWGKCALTAAILSNSVCQSEHSAPLFPQFKFLLLNKIF